MDNLLKILDEIGLPIAYDHFAEGEAPSPPFVCYLLPDSNHFLADGVVFHKFTVVHFELYTEKKDLSLEEKIEHIFDVHQIIYAKSEVWIESERLFEVLYTFELEV